MALKHEDKKEYGDILEELDWSVPCNIDNLPQEVLSHVFLFLSIKERLSASLVCKKWLNATDKVSLLDGICVTLHPERFQMLSKKSIGEKHVYWSRRFYNFKFIDIEFSSEVLSYLQEYGECIKVLTLKTCRINEDDLNSIAETSYCCNLKKLTFYGCMIDIFHTLPYLQELVIDCSTGVLTDHNLANLDKAISRLETFMLFLRQNVLHSEDMIREIYGDTVSGNDYASKTTLTLPALVSFLKSNSHSLAEVNIDGGGDWQAMLYIEFLKINNLKLRRLILDCPLLLDSRALSVEKALMKFSTVTELILVQDDREHLDAICKLLPNLTSLNVESSQVTNLKGIFSLSHLRNLSFQEVHFSCPMDEEFEAALSVYKLNKLKHFELGGTNISAKMLICLLKRMTTLHSLTLFGSGLTGKTVQFICEHLVRLRTLKMFFNPKSLQLSSNADTDSITAAYLLKIAKFPSLHTFHACPVEEIPDNFEGELLKNNPNLCNIGIHEYCH